MQEHTSLTLEEYRRYGRQMILRGFGLPGQLKLKNAKVAVIGAGGLGCPALQYLAGAGVGTIGIFDFDTVEASNLHRQVLHTTARVGEYKAESAKAALTSLNPHITIIPHTCPLLPSTALSLLAPYNLVLDCTDRPQTRYLVNDACVRLDVPLVSGAAIEWAGQWCVLGGYHQGGLPVPAAESQREDGNQKGVGRATWPAHSLPTASSDQMSPPPTPTPRTRRPCYRCLFPQPLANTSGNDRSGTCEEEGVYGPIVGVVGVQMAAEAIKVVLGVDDPLPRLNLISMSPALTADPASTSTPFRSIRVRGPSGKCKACGEGPGVVVGDDLEAVGYDEFCGVRKTDDESKGNDKAGEKDGIPEGTTTQASVERISVQGLKDGFYGGRIPGGYVTSLDPVLPGRPGRSEEGDGKKILVDVRAELEYGLCALPGSTNIPMESFLSDPIGRLRSISQTADLPSEVYFMCRRGNDSSISAQALRAALSESESEAGKEGERCRVKDVVGGVRAWSDQVDPTFPMY